jgi:hypothetical protein
MSTIKQIADLVKRRKAVLDGCIRGLRAADEAHGGMREEAVRDAAGALAEVRAMTKQIDDLYVAQIAELEGLRAEAARQGAEAISAAQGAIVRLSKQ